MYLHKEERELFHDVILLTSQKMNFTLFFHPFVVLLEFGSGFKSKHYSASNSSNSSREEL